MAEKKVYAFPKGEEAVSMFNDDRGNIYVLTNKGLYSGFSGTYTNLRQVPITINVPDEDTGVTVEAQQEFDPLDEIPF